VAVADCHDATDSPSDPGRSHDGAPLVVLVGPPNSGKTTLFNRLTGLRQKVANYPGVTVEKHLGRVALPDGTTVELLDLPGIHGFSGRSLDERVTMDALRGRIEGLPLPDAVILIVDATRLETQLLLAEPVLARGVPTLLVLNMADELAAGGGEVKEQVLADEWGVQVVRTSARDGGGVDDVRDFLRSVAQRSANGAHVTDGNGAGAQRMRGAELPVLDQMVERRRRVQDAVRRASYVAPHERSSTERIDSVALHPAWGPLLFLAVIILVFQSIFTWAVPLMDGVDALIVASGSWIGSVLPDSWVRSLIVDGIWAGVGSVVIFLPQILILFLFLGLLEDSGYLARAAVIADRLMQPFGLQGRAFLPLLSGYACAIPAILAARTVEEERDRLATIFVTPFMTCSARLPVYALLIAAFIPDVPVMGPFLGARAATLLGLYALGLIAAVGTAFLLRRTLLRGPSSGFVIELPPYRMPTLRSIAYRLTDRSRIFLKRAGTIILAVAIVLWVLTQFPRTPAGPPAIEDSALGKIGQVIEPTIEPLGLDWRFGVGLVSSLAAREVIVGTLGTIYGVENADEGSTELRAVLQRDLDLGAAVGLLVFFVFALQCMSTVAVMRRETAGWKWPIFQFTYMLALAWIGAYLANRLI
jgi:ferrous iron transport protein B